MNGTVKKLDFEGGFWGILGDDGDRFAPINLPESLRKDGLKVAFDISDERFMGATQWGRTVKLTSVSRAD